MMIKAIGERFLCLLLCVAMLIGWCGFFSLDARASVAVAPMVSVGNAFMLALDSDGCLHSWGENASGTLGNGSTSSSAHPVAVSLPENVRMAYVSAGFDHALAISTDGDVYAWGSNEYGQLGTDGNDLLSVPTKLEALSGQRMISVAAGKQFSLALSESGIVYAWGNNASLQLGTALENGETQCASPRAVSSLNGVFVTAIFADFSSAAAIASDGSVWLWGKNDSFQLGVDTASTLTPQKLTKSNLPNVAQTVAIGEKFITMLFSDDTVASIGQNRYGQFANGKTSTDGSAVLKFATLGEIAPMSVAASSDQTVVLDADGTLYTAGRRLGEADMETQTAWTEFRIGNASEQLIALTMDAGYVNGAVVAQDGTVWTWGENGSGQLGDGTLSSSATAVRVVSENGSALALGNAPYVQSVALFVNASVPAPTYTVTIPDSIELGDLRQTDALDTERISSTEFVVRASGIANLFGERKIVVTLTTSDGTFVLRDSGGHALPYAIYLQESGGTALSSGDPFAEFTTDGSVTGWLRVDRSQITQSGVYGGVLTFGIDLETVED